MGGGGGSWWMPTRMTLNDQERVRLLSDDLEGEALPGFPSSFLVEDLRSEVVSTWSCHDPGSVTSATAMSSCGSARR